MRYLTFVIALFAGCHAGCGSVCPQVKATRCNGQTVEICGTNKKWQRAMACDQIRPLKSGAATNWVCRKVDEEHECVPGGDK
jgi:hypothetical protein